jgi:hypothetical protein
MNVLHEWSASLSLSVGTNIANSVHYICSTSYGNILHEISKRKANRIGLILRWNCLLQQVIEGKGKIKGRIEVTGRWGRKCRKLLDDLKERSEYSRLKEEALDRTMWRARFGRVFGPVVRQTNEWMNEYGTKFYVLEWNCIMTNIVHKFLIYLSIYLCLICPKHVRHK